MTRSRFSGGTSGFAELTLNRPGRGEGGTADLRSINNIVTDAVHGFDASRHRLHFGHTQASLSVTLNLGDFIVCSGISAIKASKLLFAALDLHAIHFTKAIFRDALYSVSLICVHNGTYFRLFL